MGIPGKKQRHLMAYCGFMRGDVSCIDFSDAGISFIFGLPTISIILDTHTKHTKTRKTNFLVLFLKRLFFAFLFCELLHGDVVL